jgi:hypothetical protein
MCLVRGLGIVKNSNLKASLNGALSLIKIPVILKVNQVYLRTMLCLHSLLINWNPIWTDRKVLDKCIRQPWKGLRQRIARNIQLLKCTSF